MLRRLLPLLAGCSLLVACDSWLGENAPPPLPGKRIAILDETRTVSVDPGEKAKILLPRPESLPDWPQAGGTSTHAMHHLQVSKTLQKVWKSSIGTGGSKRQVFLTQPVVQDGKVYAMDATSMLSAYALNSGERLWKLSLTPDDDSDSGSYPGGLAADEGKIFAVNGHAQLVAVSQKDQKILWRQSLPAPVRGAPTVRAGRVIVITAENETIAFAADDGRRIWRHAGITETALILGGTSPAIDGNTVVVPYSSGELFALRVENGVFMWGDALLSLRHNDQVAQMTDIRGLPVIDRGVLYAVGNSDTMAAIDLRSGRRIWDRTIGSTQTPWIVGDYIYVLSNAAEVICLQAATGRILWVRTLDVFSDPEEKKGRIAWNGPVLASDRLIVTNSEGQAVSISPYSGEILGKVDLSGGTHMPPIVAGSTLLFITDDGDLLAYR